MTKLGAQSSPSFFPLCRTQKCLTFACEVLCSALTSHFTLLWALFRFYLLSESPKIQSLIFTSLVWFILSSPVLS